MLISHIISLMLFMNYASFSFLQCQTRVLIPGKLTSDWFIIWMALAQCSTPWWCTKIYWNFFRKSETENHSLDSSAVYSAKTKNLWQSLFIVSKINKLLVWVGLPLFTPTFLSLFFLTVTFWEFNDYWLHSVSRLWGLGPIFLGFGMEMSCDLMNEIKVKWTIITVQQSHLTLHFKFQHIIH